MPYAQNHYPFEQQREFEARFPADFIAEGIDQTRAWFYTLTVLAVVALITFDTLAHALLVPAVFLALATIEGQIVSPIIVGRRLSLSPLVVVIALMIGGWVWGVVGVLLAVPILVMVKIYLTHSEHLQPFAEVLGRD